MLQPGPEEASCLASVYLLAIWLALSLDGPFPVKYWTRDIFYFFTFFSLLSMALFCQYSSSIYLNLEELSTIFFDLSPICGWKANLSS